jgi:hypothetical protein
MGGHERALLLLRLAVEAIAAEGFYAYLNSFA